MRRCVLKTGRRPTSVRWVDIDEGEEGGPNYRSRLVASDIKGDDDLREDFFGSMPPLQAKKMLFAMAASQLDRKGVPLKLMFIDIEKAHLCGKCADEDAYIELPEEYGAPGVCGELVCWLYGMRGAARGWKDECRTKMMDIGFVEGCVAPTVVVDVEKEVRLVVRGDNFTFLGPEVELLRIADQMEEWCEIKARGILGGRESDLKKIVILNRESEWKEDCLVHRADSKRARIIVDEMGLTLGLKKLGFPGKKDEPSIEHEVELDEAESKRFRAIAARVNYLALDRPDIQYSVKELCRVMSKRTRRSWSELQELAIT
jgi:hypothetical protein